MSTFSSKGHQSRRRTSCKPNHGRKDKTWTPFHTPGNEVQTDWAGWELNVVNGREDRALPAEQTRHHSSSQLCRMLYHTNNNTRTYLSAESSSAQSWVWKQTWHCGLGLLPLCCALLHWPTCSAPSTPFLNYSNLILFCILFLLSLASIWPILTKTCKDVIWL